MLWLIHDNLIASANKINIIIMREQAMATIISSQFDLAITKAYAVELAS